MSFFRQKNIRTYFLCLNNYSAMMSFCIASFGAFCTINRFDFVK